MAYKSRVTNKYMGSSFAGQVTSSRTSTTSDLINTLQREVNPALAKIADQYVETKKDTAKEKINQLLLTKDSKTVQQEILAGKHPELSNQYVQKVVDFNVGRTAAAEAIVEIEKNKSSYNFKETNLPAFYKQYLPEFADKSSTYALGFAGVFEKFKANDAISDAETRSKFNKEQKITGVLKVANLSENAAEWWGTTKSYTDQKLFNGSFLSIDEQNEAAITNALNIVDTAETTSEIDKALSILEHDRGVGKDGKTKLGSLINTKRSDVADAYGKLKRRRVTLVRQEREDSEFKRIKRRTDVFKEAMADNEDGTPKTHKQLAPLRDKLEKEGDVSGTVTFDKLYYSNINSKIDLTERDKFAAEVRNGGYTSIDEVRRAMANRGLHPSLQTEMYKEWDVYNERSKKGLKPIHISDDTYSRGIKQIQDAVLEGMKDKDGLFSAGNGKLAVANATRYMEKQIHIEEAEFKAQNGREMNWRERSAIIEDLTKRIVPLFKLNENPTLKSLNEYDQEDLAKTTKKEQQTIKQQEKVKIETQKYGDIKNKIELNIANIKPPKLRQTAIAGIISESRKEEIQTLPKIEKYLMNVLGGQKFDSEFFSSLTADTAEYLITNIAKQLNITPAQLDKYLQTILSTEYEKGENLNNVN